MPEKILDTAFDSVRGVAEQVHRCPSCNSEHIYTAVSVAYIYDHQRPLGIGAAGNVNLAEHGWHGCFMCNHQWVSNPMIQSGLLASRKPERPDNVIDFQAAKSRR